MRRSSGATPTSAAPSRSASTTRLRTVGGLLAGRGDAQQWLAAAEGALQPWQTGTQPRGTPSQGLSAAHGWLHACSALGGDSCCGQLTCCSSPCQAGLCGHRRALQPQAAPCAGAKAHAATSDAQRKRRKQDDKALGATGPDAHKHPPPAPGAPVLGCSWLLVLLPNLAPGCTSACKYCLRRCPTAQALTRGVWTPDWTNGRQQQCSHLLQSGLPLP